MANKSLKSLGSIFWHELLHHLPYATFSVALALMLLSLINIFFDNGLVACTTSEMYHEHVHHAAHAACSHTHNHVHGSGMDILFHSFHFIHILFASSGAMLTFYRYSKNWLMGFFVGALSAVVFCTFSDILLPYAAGSLLGVDMELHICFQSELHNIMPFLVVGLLNGLILPYSDDFMSKSTSLTLHFWHTFISAMASIFYAIGHGLPNFYDHFGMFFILMVVAVIIPCTLSDVISPIFFARMISEK